MALSRTTLLDASQSGMNKALQTAVRERTVAFFTARTPAPSAQESARFNHYLEFLQQYALKDSSVTAQELKQKLEEAPDEWKPLLAETFVRFGQVGEIAGLISRDNAFKISREKGEPVAGGAEELVKQFKSAEHAVKALTAPTFAMTFTAHPTNVVSLDAIQTQRALLRAIDAVRYNKPDADAKLDAALKAFVTTPVMTMGENQEAKKLTVRDETEHMLHYMRTLYYDLPHIYDRFDEPLRAKFHENYPPLSLRLQMPLTSWGSSGDKDGNANVTAETTLRAMAMHAQAIVELYCSSLSKLDAPSLAPMRAALESKREQCNAALDAIDAALNQRIFLPEAEFDALSARLAQAMHTGIDAKEMEQTLLRAMNAPDAQDKATRTALLDMVRRVRQFGLEGMKLEYRETAEEFTRIISALIPEYASMSEDQRSLHLTQKLKSPEALSQLQLAMRELAAKGQGTPYNKKDAAPIAYHTLKRMELARDFPTMVVDHVLAECQGTSNFMETLLLQKLASKEGKSPMLGIIPLFEEYGTLSHAHEILKTAFNTPAYHSHLKEIGALRGDGQLTQQVQLAHSDNARRAGMPAARAFIYDAHNTIRKACKEAGVAVQFYEGGSQSDPYRGGVRALSASINEFGIHDFAKFTFQGGDLLNYLNYPSSAIRLFTRNISHAAGVLARKEEGFAAKTLAKPAEEEIRAHPVLDHHATTALKRTVQDYEACVFNNTAFNGFMEKIGYNAEKEAGTVGSRAGQRSTSTEVNVKEARTISFSEALQHAGITPTWIGAKNLYTYLSEEAGKPLGTDDLHSYYQRSPVFRDVIDRMLFGLAKTDIEGLRVRNPELKSSMFLDDLAQEYRYCARVALQAATGIRVTEAEVSHGAGVRLRDIRQRIIQEALPHIAPLMEEKHRYMDTIGDLRSLWCNRPENAQERTLRSLLHAAGDTVHHGRFLAADDPAYGQMLAGKQPQPAVTRSV